jgi:hypothetical protein
MEWRQVVRKAMCVIGPVLLGHAASSEPPKGKLENGSFTASVSTDRVGFPKDYRTRFKVLGVIIKEEALRVSTVYGNEQAATVTSRDKLPFPEGSIIIVEFSDALRDANNQVVRDANGALQSGVVEHIDVMKRGKGFGEAYGENRSGEWEYAGYRLDGSYTTTPEKSVQCAACHRKAGPENDFVFRMGTAPARMQ